MADPQFLTQTHDDIKSDILLDYIISRPASDAEEASDIDVKADILAGNVKHLQWRQTFILRQIFAETQEMPYLILSARNIAGIAWDDGVRAQGYLKFTAETPPVADITLPSGTIFVSVADPDGNIVKAALLADAVLKAGESYTLGLAEVVEIEAEALVSYEIPSSGGGVHVVAIQEIGSGSAGNLPDKTFTAFEGTPPAGVDAVSNLTPGLSQGHGFTASSLFTITLGTNDQMTVDIDGAGTQSITLSAGINLSGATVAADIQAKIRAIATGGYAQALCLYNLTGTDYRFILFSGTTGAPSSVTLTAGGNDALPSLGLDELTELSGGRGFVGGIDPQTKESLRSEYERAIQKGGEAGTVGDYVVWAKDSGQGVDDAKVSGLSGAVSVFPISNSGVLFTTTQLTAIKDYIETKAPVHLIGSILVANPVVTSIYVIATIVLESGFLLSNVTTSIRQAVKDYVLSVVIGDTSGNGVVRFNKISSAILAVNGVVDATGLVVDLVAPPLGTANITLADGSVAQTDDAKIVLN